MLDWIRFVFIGVLERIVYYDINKYTFKDAKISSVEEKEGIHFPLILFRSKQIIANEAEIKKMCDYKDGTILYKIKSQIFFSKNIIKTEQYHWFVNKITDVRSNIISKSNLDINIIIAVNMFNKQNYGEREINLFRRGLKEQGTEILLQKQIEWEEYCTFQLSQLPFD